MRFKMNRKNSVVCISAIFLSIIVLCGICPHNTYGEEMNFPHMDTVFGHWISGIYHDENGNERLAIVNIDPRMDTTLPLEPGLSPEPGSFFLTEYVREKPGKNKPYGWSKTNAVHEISVEDVAMSREGRQLILDFDRNEANWPVVYHQYSESAFRLKYDAAESVVKLADVIGQWMCYSVDSRVEWMSLPFIYTLTISEDGSFKLSMHYDDPGSPGVWSLWWELVGNLSSDPDRLEGKHFYAFHTGIREELPRGDYWQSDKPTKIFYAESDDELIMIFSAARDKDRRFYRFHRATNE